MAFWGSYSGECLFLFDLCNNAIAAVPAIASAKAVIMFVLSKNPALNLSLETDVEYLSEAVTEVVPITVVSAGSVSMTVLVVSDSDITSEINVSAARVSAEVSLVNSCVLTVTSLFSSDNADTLLDTSENEVINSEVGVVAIISGLSIILTSFLLIFSALPNVHWITQNIQYL